MANFTSNTQIHGCTLIRVIIIIFALFTVLESFSQRKLSSDNRKALKFYEKAQSKAKGRDFNSALEYFSDAVKQDPDFYEAYLRKGSLFNAMGMEDSVYSNFSKYLALTPTPNQSVLNNMALMAFGRGAYKQSKAYLELLLKLIPELVEKREIQLLQQKLDYSQKEVAKSRSIEITPLPQGVNRFALQYLPSITIDNSTLIYTKRDAIDGDEDIVVSHFSNGQWEGARSISPKINSPLNEGASTISADGRVMIYTSCDNRDSFGSCDLYISKRAGSSWSKPKNLGKPVNSQYWESQPSLSADGKSIYFSSNRPGGNGGRDLWVSYFGDGKWSKPENLGKPINTFKDETTPFIHPNGETLYFSSNGHIGLGGFDLVKADKQDQTWWKVSNLGFPINSHQDEVGLLIAGNGKTAYFAKEEQRNRQIVDSKIVSFTLPKEHQAKPATYIVGNVMDLETKSPLRATIEIFDIDRNELLYKTNSDSLTGDYTMVLPSDKNLASYVQKKGYLFYESNFFTKSNSMIQPDTLDIELKAIAVDDFLILKNIYFEVDSIKPNAKSKPELTNILQLLKENPSLVVEVSGHTDNSGSSAYNLRLSEDRANQVVDLLLKMGISKQRLYFVGYGDKKPVESNETEFGRQSNRRIEFRVLRMKP